MHSITSAEASAIVVAALEKAREIPCHPMTIAVVDAGGALFPWSVEAGEERVGPISLLQRRGDRLAWESAEEPWQKDPRRILSSGPP